MLSVVSVSVGQGRSVQEFTVRIEARDRSGQPVPATLTIVSEQTGKVQRGTMRSGSYTVALRAGDVYRLEAAFTGYRPAQKILRFDREADLEEARQSILLRMERDVQGGTPVYVTVIDYETKRLISRKINVQIQEVNGRRINMTGPPREGRFTFLSEFGQKVVFTVSVEGYEPYTYNIDVKDQHDITIALRRAGRPAPAEPTPTQAPPPAQTAPPAAGGAVASNPAPRTPEPETKPEQPSAPAPATVNTDLSTLARGKTVTLDNVYFDQSSYLLRPESYPQLNQLVALLKTRSGLKIEISGHTDNVGDPRLNLALSENRAKVITTYLITNGIAENRLRYRGYGQTQPIAPNDTEENKRKNRRVEVKVLEE
ncbi:OmpA family protein [Larkinella soli]|uniref:OmpA family protein n=1 Tax=Larkinella soli TaxID=1770527 RepID=UPI001E509012|nr:OmpA family protein [Larkinella soli]